MTCRPENGPGAGSESLSAVSGDPSSAVSPDLSSVVSPVVSPAPSPAVSRQVTPSICSRVLLYTRGMDLDPLCGLELALEALRRAEAGACARAEERPGLVCALEELYARMRENAVSLRVLDGQGRELRSAPPMNRQSMIAEEMDITPVRSAVKRLLRKWTGFGAPAGKGGAHER